MGTGERAGLVVVTPEKEIKLMDIFHKGRERAR